MGKGLSPATTWCYHAALWIGILCVCQIRADAETGQKTSMEWRDDERNAGIVRLLNQAYSRLPFSREYEGVSDTCPFQLTWAVGSNLPVAWKGGVAGILGDQIALAGGLWMPDRRNLAYAYEIRGQSYKPIPPPPFETAYTQGTCDGERLYLVGGRSAGRNVAALSRTKDGGWRWSTLATLPEAEGQGRWLAAVATVPGKWLFLLSGHPTGTPSELRTTGQLPDYRLRLDLPDARWEPMAAYPGGPRALIQAAMVRGKVYAFGGSHPDPVMRQIHRDLVDNLGVPDPGKGTPRHAINAPYAGVPNYRDACCYDPAADRWQPIRSTPFPVAAGAPVVLDDRYVLLMGSADVRTFRIGKAKGSNDPYWRGYGDRILCYDVEKDTYSHAGVMVYGVATSPWVTDGRRVYGFGGEPAHGYNENTENVLQIGLIERTK
jgi:hypothetical protein